MLNNQSGQSILEIIVTIALMGVILPALLTGIIASRDGKVQEDQRIRATALLKEGVEAIRSVRESGWSNIESPQIIMGNTYYIATPGSSWSLTATNPNNTPGFTRTIIIADTQRDSSGTIVSSGGTVDPSTKKVTVTVTWGTSSSEKVEFQFYLTRYLDNQTFTETTDSDFNAVGAIKTNVDVFGTGVSAGVRLALLGGVGGAGADWCFPNPASFGTFEIQGSGAANAVTAIVGEAFVGTGANNSGPALQRVTGLSANPPSPADGGTFSDGHKTNDIFGDPDYMYIATDTNAKEVVIVSKSSLTQAGFYNASGNRDGVSIFVSTFGSNRFGFVTLDNSTLQSINLTTISGSSSQPVIDTEALGALGTSIYVVGNYAYVTRNATTEQLRIYEIDPSTGLLTLRGSFTVPAPGALGAQDVHVSSDGNRAYIVTARSTILDQHEFFVVDTTNKTSPTKIGSFNEQTGMNPRAVEMVLSKGRAIMVGSGGTEYQVLRLSTNEANPTYCGGYDEPSGTIYDIASVEITGGGDNRAFAYIAVGANPEFKIIQGGTGGEFVASGTFESQTLPSTGLTADAAFNRFNITFTEPATSNIEYQIAVKDQVSGSCSGVTFTNADFVALPSGTSADRYQDDSAIFLNNDGLGYENPGRCFRYRAYLSPSSDYKQTPEFQDITVNYTP